MFGPRRDAASASRSDFACWPFSARLAALASSSVRPLETNFSTPES
jgi:hypothetical protein